MAIMARGGDRFRPVTALLIKRSVLGMATDRLLLSVLDMLTKNGLRERVCFSQWSIMENTGAERQMLVLRSSCRSFRESIHSKLERFSFHSISRHSSSWQYWLLPINRGIFHGFQYHLHRPEACSGNKPYCWTDRYGIDVWPGYLY